MSRYLPWDMRERGGEIVKEIVDPSMTVAFRRAEVVNDIHISTLEQMLRRACEDRTAQLDEAWNQCAKILGYESLEALHAEGFNISIDHVKKAIVLRKRPGSPPSESGNE